MTGTPATGEEPTEAPEPTEQPESNVKPVVSGANAAGGSQAGASSGTGGAVIQPSATGSTLIINKNNFVIIHFIVLRIKGNWNISAPQIAINFVLMNCNSIVLT